MVPFNKGTPLKQTGFTLVELLVAIATGALLVSAIYSLFIMQNHSYANQNNVADMQQNVRIAMSVLSSDLRMAGYGFSINGTYISPTNTTVYAVTPTNSSIAPDSITIRYGVNGTTLSAAITNSTGAALQVTGTSGFVSGDFVIISDGQNAACLQLNGAPAGNMLPYAATAVNIFPSGGFAAGSNVYVLRQVSYQVSNNILQSRTDNGAWQNVVNYVEDLQLAYRGTSTPVGTWVDNPIPVNQTTLNNIQLNIMSRTGMADSKFTGQRPALRDHSAGLSDNFRRRVLTSTVRTRNL
ncbi:MAG: prepilin-type N-terminal cleavage/methylation domain-containing protein [Thermodesulfobacteriota bacterium]